MGARVPLAPKYALQVRTLQVDPRSLRVSVLDPHAAGLAGHVALVLVDGPGVGLVDDGRRGFDDLPCAAEESAEGEEEDEGGGCSDPEAEGVEVAERVQDEGRHPADG